MTDPQDGAPVEWEGVKRYEAFGVLFNYDDHQPVQPEVNRCTVVLASDHDAALAAKDAEIARLTAALTDLEMAVSDLMREQDFEISDTLSCALDVARSALGLWTQP